MICPECGGTGRVRRRFLIFFKRWRRCRTCLGTGEFPPPGTRGFPFRTRVRDDDDADGWLARGAGAGAIDSLTREPREPETRGRDDAFDVGSGGRSGGAGASASWDEPAGENAPLIVDPFAADSGAAGSALAVETADTSRDDSSSDNVAADEGDAPSADTGTSY